MFKFGSTVSLLLAVAAAEGKSIWTRNAGTSVRDILDKETFESMFSLRYTAMACKAGNDALTYENFVAACETYYPEAFTSGISEEDNKRELAAFLGQISQETTGWWKGQEYSWGLCFTEEVACKEQGCKQYESASSTYPPVPGQSYHGRGAMQVTWNVNYGQVSEAIYGDKNVLLQNPSLLASDGELMFRSALWFWMTPQGVKPSCHDIMLDNVPSETCRPNGFGATTNVINGGLECGAGSASLHEPGNKVYNRIAYYKRYCQILGVSPGSNLECKDQINYNTATCPDSGSTSSTSSSLRCGSSWEDANTKCGTPCPGGTTEECPSGEICYASLETSVCADTETSPVTEEQPVDCEGVWSEFGECSVACGGGIHTRTYSITQQAENDGNSCPHSHGFTETQSCNNVSCIPTTSSAVEPCSTATVYTTNSITNTVTFTVISTVTETVDATEPTTSVSASASASSTSTVVAPTTSAGMTAPEESVQDICSIENCNNGCWDGNYCWTIWDAEVCGRYENYIWCL